MAKLKDERWRDWTWMEWSESYENGGSDEDWWDWEAYRKAEEAATPQEKQAAIDRRLEEWRARCAYNEWRDYKEAPWWDKPFHKVAPRWRKIVFIPIIFVAVVWGPLFLGAMVLGMLRRGY